MASLLGRWRQGVAAIKTLRTPVPGESQDFSFAAEIPLAGSDTPLWRIKLQIASEPHGDGEKIRLRAHIQSNFASALRPALTASQVSQRALAAPSRVLKVTQRAGALAQRAAARAIRLPLLRTLAEPLLEHDLNTWIEINASTASLDRSSRELLPQSDKLAALGIHPASKTRGPADGPLMENWAGEAPGGFAQVSLLQIDKQHLPPRLVKSLGEKPFALAAAIVNTVDRR